MKIFDPRFFNLGFFYYFYTIKLIIMKTIQFPIDFTITENPYLNNAVNYIHERPDGSIISILQPENSEFYEIWDERYMEFPEVMDYYELITYLESTVSQLLTYQFFLNEDLTLN